MPLVVNVIRRLIGVGYLLMVCFSIFFPSSLFQRNMLKMPMIVLMDSGFMNMRESWE